MIFQVYNFDDSETTVAIRTAEDIAYTNWTCTTPATRPTISFNKCDGQAFTSDSGIINDLWSFFKGEFLPAACGTDITDNWQWCDPAKNDGKPIATFGKLVGYSHTDAVKVNNYTAPDQLMPKGTIIRADGTTIIPQQ